jgi:AcrR family transcriptional regulator
VALSTGEAGRSGDPASSAAAERRNTILDVAEELAIAGGYDAVTMRAVAYHANLSVPTVYQYFPNKDVLILAVAHRRVIPRYEALARHTLQMGNSPAMRLKAFVTWSLHGHQCAPRFVEASVKALNSTSGGGHALRAAQTDSIRQLLERHLAGLPQDIVTRVSAVVLAVLRANTLDWANGVCTFDELRDAMYSAVDLLMAAANSACPGLLQSDAEPDPTGVVVPIKVSRTPEPLEV